VEHGRVGNQLRRDHGARVVNMSYVGAAASSTIQSAANYLRSKGGVLFVASGNTGTLDSTAPTTSMTVVGATMSDDTIGRLLHLRQLRHAVRAGLQHPDKRPWAAATGIGGARRLATPVAAGVAALVIAKRPDFTAAQIDSTLQSSAVDLGAPGKDNYFGAGRVDAGAALLLAAGGSTPPPSDTTPADDHAGLARYRIHRLGHDLHHGECERQMRPLSRASTSASAAARSALSSTAPYTLSWDSTSVANMSGTLLATAYDARGQRQIRNSAFMTVNNTVAPPADTTAPA